MKIGGVDAENKRLKSSTLFSSKGRKPKAHEICAHKCEQLRLVARFATSPENPASQPPGSQSIGGRDSGYCPWPILLASERGFPPDLRPMPAARTFWANAPLSSDGLSSYEAYKPGGETVDIPLTILPRARGGFRARVAVDASRTYFLGKRPLSSVELPSYEPRAETGLDQGEVGCPLPA